MDIVFIYGYGQSSMEVAQSWPSLLLIFPTSKRPYCCSMFLLMPVLLLHPPPKKEIIGSKEDVI